MLTGMQIEEAVINDNACAIRNFLIAGKIKNPSSWLNIAVDHNSLNVIEFLSKNFNTYKGDALDIAVENGLMDVVITLVENGDSLDLRRACRIAVEYGRNDIAEYLENYIGG